jgi:hypothetical protein
MSDTTKFEVIDRRKYKAQEEQENAPQPEQKTPPAPPREPSEKPAEPANGPRLVSNENRRESSSPQVPSAATGTETAPGNEVQLPPVPTAEESHEQKAAYDASAQRVEDLIRAQNPAMGAQPPVTFDQLVQQLYLTAMLEMGAGTQEGQRPQVDIVGARSTIDLMGILAEKTRGNLTDAEDRALESMLFDARMAFLELTNMISMPSVKPPPRGKK